MATVNLGRIKFVWQGAYSGATAYVADDVVSYNGSSYICILASTGNLPTNATYWNLMAQTGTDITSLAGLAQGDVLYYNGTSWVRLGAGTSGQFLKTNGASANPSWGTVTTKFVSAQQVTHSTRFSIGSSSGNQTLVASLGSITKVNSDTVSDLYFHIMMPTHNMQNNSSFIEFTLNKSGGGAYSTEVGLPYGSNAGSMNSMICGNFKFTGLPAGTYSITQVLKSNGTPNNGGFVLNPNSSDDARNNQLQSHYLIYEILQ
jgi:hypothetical protein